MAAREPAREIQNWAQSMDYLDERLESPVERKMENHRAALERMEALIEGWNPDREIQQTQELILRVSEKLDEAIDRSLKSKREAANHLHHLLLASGPEKTLNRGFSMTLNEKEKPIDSASQLKDGQKMVTRFADGKVTSRVEKK